MAAVPLVPLLLSAAIGVGGAVAAKALGPKPPKPVKALAQPTRIEARERAERSDILSRRRGTDANKRVGYGAGEAFTGPRRSLLGRS